MSAKPTTLTISAQWEPKTIDPHEYGYLSHRLGYTESLTGVDAELKVTPSLATSWTVSPDGKTWTFTLRKGVLFHDGTPFTADAMKKSLERSLKKSKVFAEVPFAGIEAPDSQTLVIRLNKSFIPLPAYLSKGEAAALSSSSWDVNGTIVKPVGTGPFVFESWKPKEEVVTVKNANYWGQKASVDKVVYRIVPEALTRSMLMKSGEIQVAMIMPPEIAVGYMNQSMYTVEQQSIPRVRMISFNNKKTPFNDARVRKAVSYAIDRNAIITSVLEGIGTPGAGVFPPGSYWANSSIQPYPYDPDTARRLLAEAGWKDTNGDGIVEKDGKPFKVKFITYPTRAELPPTAEVIQQQMKKAGMDAEVVVMENSACDELVKKGQFDMYLVGRGVLFTPDPDEIMMTDYHSSGTAVNAYGAVAWNNNRVDTLIGNARTIDDPAARKAMYDEVQSIVYDESPVLYLNYYVNLDISNDKIKGYDSHPNEYSYHLENVRFV
ncbi:MULTISPECIES: ABC transporter substrate-binding protein [unclassified Methanoregula]|uniref:ABC transporter substrate-binding protein n=1 Tax=unclassified Methanoregula TaxID=2649730 RepID=UPI0025EE324C|nr:MULTISPECIES: ABC transporter substrate-binding protein [unclassified Methanoregula]